MSYERLKRTRGASSLLMVGNFEDSMKALSEKSLKKCILLRRILHFSYIYQGSEIVYHEVVIFTNLIFYLEPIE